MRYLPWILAGGVALLALGGGVYYVTRPASPAKPKPAGGGGPSIGGFNLGALASAGAAAAPAVKSLFGAIGGALSSGETGDPGTDDGGGDDSGIDA